MKPMSDQRYLYPKLNSSQQFVKLMFSQKSGFIKSCIDKDIIQIEYQNIRGNIIQIFTYIF